MENWTGEIAERCYKVLQTMTGSGFHPKFNGFKWQLWRHQVHVWKDLAGCYLKNGLVRGPERMPKVAETRAGGWRWKGRSGCNGWHFGEEMPGHSGIFGNGGRLSCNSWPEWEMDKKHRKGRLKERKTAVNGTRKMAMGIWMKSCCNWERQLHEKWAASGWD